MVAVASSERDSHHEFGRRDSRHEIVRKVKEAIAPLDAAGDALADNGAGAAEGGDGGLAPRRVVRMDDRGRAVGCSGRMDRRSGRR